MTRKELKKVVLLTVYGLNDLHYLDIKRKDSQEVIDKLAEVISEQIQSRKQVKITDPVKKKSGRKDDFIDQIIDRFAELHGNYEIVNRGKERAAAGKLLSMYKKKYPGASSEDTLAGLGEFFNQCLNIQDNWLRTNMSLPLIINKFNEIKNIIQNYDPGKQRRNVSEVVDKVLNTDTEI